MTNYRNGSGPILLSTRGIYFAETFRQLSVIMDFPCLSLGAVGGTMLAVGFRIRVVIFAWASIAACWAATFGSVVPIHGTVSDIALDERRNVVWAANFSAYRVEQVDIATRTLFTPLTVPMPPSAVALSPNRRFLVVGEYQKPDPL